MAVTAALLDDLKDRLNDPSSTDNDFELYGLLEAALAEYAEWVGPVPDPLPANHREMILGDVVALFSLSQRGFVEDLDETGGRPPVPVVLFPRIRAYGRAQALGPVGSFPPPPAFDAAWL